jgi:hypothetical protein
MMVTILAIVAIVGLAAYCMVCERLADNRERAASRRAAPVELPAEAELAPAPTPAVAVLTPTR